MSRAKKSRRMKGKVGIKTGSKKNFIKPGDLGKIPSKNKLSKHKSTKQKSAYEKYLEETGQLDTSNGKQAIAQRIHQAKHQKVLAERDVAVKTHEEEREESKDFNEMSGEELLDWFNRG